MNIEAMNEAWNIEKTMHPQSSFNSWCRGYEAAIKLAKAKKEPVWCGCGDGIVADDGAKCGTCVSLLENRIERLLESNTAKSNVEPTPCKCVTPDLCDLHDRCQATK